MAAQVLVQVVIMHQMEARADLVVVAKVVLLVVLVAVVVALVVKVTTVEIQ